MQLDGMVVIILSHGVGVKTKLSVGVSSGLIGVVIVNQ